MDKYEFLSGTSSNSGTIQNEKKKSNTVKTSSGSSNINTGYYEPQRDYYAELMAAIEAKAAAQRQAKIAAIDNQLNGQLSAYDEQAAGLEPQYQQYKNQSEVERYKAQKSLREALANRGALDSGAGRQETLDLQNNYGNNLNKINLQYQSEIDAINRAKQQLRSEAEFQKQQVSADIDNVGLEAKIAALQSQIANQQSKSRTMASNAAGAQTQSQIGTSAVTDQPVSNNALKNSAYGVALAMANKAGGPLNANALLKSWYDSGAINEDDVLRLSSQYGINSWDQFKK